MAKTSAAKCDYKVLDKKITSFLDMLVHEWKEESIIQDICVCAGLYIREHIDELPGDEQGHYDAIECHRRNQVGLIRERYAELTGIPLNDEGIYLYTREFLLERGYIKRSIFALRESA